MQDACKVKETLLREYCENDIYVTFNKTLKYM